MRVLQTTHPLTFRIQSVLVEIVTFRLEVLELGVKRIISSSPYIVQYNITFVCWISGILGHIEPDSNSNWLCISNTTNTIGILYFRSTWLIRGGISLQFSSDLSAENCQDFRWRKSLLQQETNPGVSNCFLHTKAFDYYWLEKKSFSFF